MKPLRFRPDGSFRIVQYTDVDFKDLGDTDQQSFELMKRIVEIDSPDLIVFSGDVVHTHPTVAPIPIWHEFIRRTDALGIPWTFTFGNHDYENSSYETVDEILKTSNLNFYESGPKDVHGWGNYALPVLCVDKDEPAAVVFSLDSGIDGDGSLSGWGYVHEDQVDWFRHQAENLLGPDVTGLVFVHNPVIEYQTMWDTATCRGSRYESIAFQGKDTGLFTAIRDSGVSAMFCGHDHINDYEGTWEGVDLCYGRASGISGYGREGFLRGGRIIDLCEGKRGYTSFIRLEDGSMADLPVHEPENPAAS